MNRPKYKMCFINNLYLSLPNLMCMCYFTFRCIAAGLISLTWFWHVKDAVVMWKLLQRRRSILQKTSTRVTWWVIWFPLQRLKLCICVHIKELTLSLIKPYWQTKNSNVCVFIWESVRFMTEMIQTIKPFLFSFLSSWFLSLPVFLKAIKCHSKKAFLKKVVRRFYLTRTSIPEKKKGFAELFKVGS